MSELKSKLTALGVERVLQSPDGRTLKVAHLKFVMGWFGVELLDEDDASLGTLQFEQAPTLLHGDGLYISGLQIEVSLKVSFT